MIVNWQKHRCAHFRLASLFALMTICAAIFAVWRSWATRTLPLDNLPLVKQGMLQHEVDELIGEAAIFDRGGGVYRWTNFYSDGRHSAAVEFVEGRVAEVWLDDRLISPPAPPPNLWKAWREEESRKSTSIAN
jgi:hypothetical protein